MPVKSKSTRSASKASTSYNSEDVPSSMVSLRGLYLIVRIPFKLLAFLVKYPFAGGINEKFRTNLIKSLKLYVCRLALAVPVRDSAVLSIMSSHFLLNKLLKVLYPQLTNLHSYGEKFDDHSYYIVDSPFRDPAIHPVIIYLHGGGYYFGTVPQQAESLLCIYHLLPVQKQRKLTVLHLDYKLASHGYPMTNQLHDLLQTYDKLVKEGNKNIILLGDSAGGHLSIVFMQYLRHHPNLHLPYPKHVILVSPWCKVVPDDHQNLPGGSYHDNHDRDMIQFPLFRELDRKDDLLGDADFGHIMVSPGNNSYDHSDWEKIPTLTEEGFGACVILGEHETFRDDILEWCKWALKCPFYDMNHYDSHGEFNPKRHEYINDEKAKIRVYMEPWGLHDSTFFFENHLISTLKSIHHHKAIDKIDNHEFFGITRIVKYLIDVI
ncbi:uncharacterized protein J8A68_001693 [[Candida] subhashii]|uniref:Alpha/beta hydrolase fold-3 domain-containing protein n=1 Tax=[Candida] subhashii TaxID=561895 RepID=A0A8J5QQF6_9ASCO|nr:uncharacterized protein J8A68_001693 [[Candida] subhashii]KAG7664811.1 hypothetical protein J8A68_001693 [[Candida] subhashii]